MKYLVIAEKPSVARSISKVIGASTADGKADEPEAVTTPDGTLSEVL